MNLADPDLELIDPTPNVHLLFVQFDKIFFAAKLARRAVVRWSKRMYSCAGICSYEGRGGLCDIALSEPLLKLRPRKDLVETLLHEMIHAFLFVTCRDQDRDGHGPNFKFHMHRINKAAGLNISIYHDFHDEVRLYLTHWWRCDGPCQRKPPYFGVVRRSVNRAPGRHDYWWVSHQKCCGGTFSKISEPENYSKKKTKAKPTADIKKYLNNNDKNVNNRNPILVPKQTNTNHKQIMPTASYKVPKINVLYNPHICIPVPSTMFSGSSQKLTGTKVPKSVDAKEVVRNAWANKKLPKMKSNPKVTKANPSVNNVKHKSADNEMKSPPMKIKRIDDYFKTSAVEILKDVYGKEFDLIQSKKSTIVEAPKKVTCPICDIRITEKEINRHIDECLNNEEIKKVSQELPNKNNDKQQISTGILSINHENIVRNVRTSIHPKIQGHIDKNTYKNNNDTETESPNIFDLTAYNTVIYVENTGNAVKVETKNKQINNVDNIRKTVNPVEKIIDSSVVTPSTSKDNKQATKCPCCYNLIEKPMEQHLDECLAFFYNNTTIPTEGASTSFDDNTNSSILIDDDDDDIFDESLTLNATGTKAPCPCCLKMVEVAEMNDHLDICLS